MGVCFPHRLRRKERGYVTENYYYFFLISHLCKDTDRFVKLSFFNSAMEFKFENIVAENFIFFSNLCDIQHLNESFIKLTTKVKVNM